MGRRKLPVMNIQGIEPMNTYENSENGMRTKVTHYYLPVSEDNPFPRFVRHYQSYMDIENGERPILDQFQWSDWKDCNVIR